LGQVLSKFQSKPWRGKEAVDEKTIEEISIEFLFGMEP
jgi:hypothetical protein